MAWTRDQMAERAAKELRDGFYVNLGIGIPTLVAEFHSAGYACAVAERERDARHGPLSFEGEEDPDLINAGKQTITAIADDELFLLRRQFRDDSGRPYRSRHSRRDGSGGERRPRELDDPRQDGEGNGRRDGPRRRRKACRRRHGAYGEGRAEAAASLHLAADRLGVVDLVITDLGVLTVDKTGGAGLTLIELAPGVSIDEIQQKTEAKLKVSPELKSRAA